MASLMRVIMLFAAMLSLSSIAKAEARVVFDFVDRIDSAKVEEASEFKKDVRSARKVEGAVIFQHPATPGTESRATFTPELPKLKDDEKLTLLVAYGLPDDGSYDDPAHPSDGVRFAVEVNGKRMLERTAQEEGWHFDRVDLSEFAGERVECVLITDPLENINYDWACWVAPQIIVDTGDPRSGREHYRIAGDKAKGSQKAQQVVLRETDENSLRRSGLGDTETSDVLRTDVDSDGDPDILERWWNGKRARWFDENDDMLDTDFHGDQVADSVQIDRDGDGYYDGPNDMTVDWADDDEDGDADLQTIAINPSSEQRSFLGAAAHYMIFVDVDDDDVHGYIDWQTFEFPCWRATNSTNLKIPGYQTNFSPDYNGNSVFLKEHAAPLSIDDPRYNWENPFAFYDEDGDGVTEMAIRFCDTRKKNKGGDETGVHYDGKIDESFVTYDLDNDTHRGNEMDFDMSLRFAGGEELDYKSFVNSHPNLKAPEWVLPYFRYTNWREIDELIYVPHEKCYEEIFKPSWGTAYLVFDEDDDDHRWERVEIYYPEGDPYKTSRWGKSRKQGGLNGHPQSDTLGDRGEFDMDFSGKGQLYVGRWDRKIHLYGAEWGAWTVDYGAEYWGSHPVIGDSSPEKAPEVKEIVLYNDRDENGFFDEISYDYDGDQEIDLKISLLDYAEGGAEGPDVAEVINPADENWSGMHELFVRISEEAWLEALELYRAVWQKDLNTRELDDLAIAASTAEKYEHAFWLKEKVFRMIDQKLMQGGAEAEPRRKELHKLYFTGDISRFAKLIAEGEWER